MNFSMHLMNYLASHNKIPHSDFKIHELILRIDTYVIRRIIATTEDDLLTYLFICDEYEEHKCCNIDYIERTMIGSSLTKSLIISYLEFMSTITDWKVFIWAYPLDQSNCCLRNVTCPNRYDAIQLENIYRNIIIEGGFKPELYYYDIPNLFPIHSECEDIKRAFEKIKNDVIQFNANYLQHTLFVQLPTRESKYKVDIFELTTEQTKHQFEWLSLNSDPELDFSTMESIKKSTNILIKRMEALSGYKSIMDIRVNFA